MARQESEREDLLREATALAERAEFTCSGAESIVAGFRRDGAASFFLSPQQVYQFNAAGELRRAFLNDQLYKADGGRLFRLTRQRSAASVDLVRHEVTNEETAAFLLTARSKLRELEAILERGEFTVIGQVPTTNNVMDRIRDWLAALPPCIVIALAPGLRIRPDSAGGF